LAAGRENVVPAPDAGESSVSSSKPSAAPEEPRARPSADAIDLLGTAGSPLAKRGGPVLVALLLGCLIGWFIGRQRR
jgi:hypothetical protein